VVEDLILRLVYFEPRLESTSEVKVFSLQSFVPGGEPGGRVLIDRYRTGFKGLLLQPVGADSVFLVGPGTKVRIKEPSQRFCLWHTGDIAEKDDPLSRKYCVETVVTPQGFCPKHRNTLRALYTLCFTLGGTGSLEYCRQLDKALAGEGRYSVYATVLHGKVKVGSTRSWRYIERLAEQPHSVSTVIAETTSSYEARSLELRLGRTGGLTEHLRFELRKVLEEDLARDVNVLVNKLRKLSQQGLTIKVGKLVKVDADDPALLRTVSERKVSELSDKTLELVSYYSGYIVFYDPAESAYAAVRANQLLHGDSVVVLS
jgi:hypothetical protein